MGKDWEVSQNAPERRAGVHQLMNQFAGGPENSRGWEKLGNSWNDPNLGMEIQDKASREVLDGEGILGSAQGRLDGGLGWNFWGPFQPKPFQDSTVPGQLWAQDSSQMFPAAQMFPAGDCRSSQGTQDLIRNMKDSKFLN